jgi:hypothetical protein
MRRGATGILALTALVGSSCAPRVDPRVQAAQDFRATVFDLIGQDDAQKRKLNGLRLGMSDQEVLSAAGAPSQRESRGGDGGESVETWVYSGQLSTLGTLIFRDGRLVQVQTN